MLSIHTSPLAALGGKESGGMNVYVHELTRALVARGHRVDVFTRSQNPHIPRVICEGLGCGGRVIHIPAGPEAPYAKTKILEHLSEFVAGVRAFIGSEGLGYDVWHAHYWLSGLTARELCRVWPHIPIIQMFHTLGEMKNRVARRAEERDHPRRIEGECMMMRCADRIIASTPDEKVQMIDLYKADGDKIQIIPPGVDLELFRPIPIAAAKGFIKRRLEDRIVLFVGRLDPVKGIDTLIRAVAIAVRKYLQNRSDVCICIIGGDVDKAENQEDPELQRLQALKEELGVGDPVTFLGPRRQEWLPFYYSAADVVVMPSLYESFGLVALEAMACGTPVVASNVGGLRFVVRDGETGFLIPEGDSGALAERIALLLNDLRLRATLGAQARRVAQRYGWDHTAEQIEALYERARRASAQSYRPALCDHSRTRRCNGNVVV